MRGRPCRQLPFLWVVWSTCRYCGSVSNRRQQPQNCSGWRCTTRRRAARQSGRLNRCWHGGSKWSCSRWWQRLWQKGNAPWCYRGGVRAAGSLTWGITNRAVRTEGARPLWPWIPQLPRGRILQEPGRRRGRALLSRQVRRRPVALLPGRHRPGDPGYGIFVRGFHRAAINELVATWGRRAWPIAC
jgi:hypothetical protein